jgi:hypothetical protein
VLKVDVAVYIRFFLLILNGLIERFERIIEKSHKANYSGTLNKDVVNCSVRLP